MPIMITHRLQADVISDVTALPTGTGQPFSPSAFDWPCDVVFAKIMSDCIDDGAAWVLQACRKFLSSMQIYDVRQAYVKQRRAELLAQFWDEAETQMVSRRMRQVL